METSLLARQKVDSKYTQISNFSSTKKHSANRPRALVISARVSHLGMISVDQQGHDDYQQTAGDP
jgi:hypothetical protein